MTGLGAFLFSTVVITFLGEILPQAWFSRHAVSMAARAAPLLRLYMFLLYPVAKPSSHILDTWLGREGILYYREREFREVIQQHIQFERAEIGRVEGIGALNFLAIDDTAISEIGSPVAPETIISLPFQDENPRFPPPGEIGFIRTLRACNQTWAVITDPMERPHFVFEVDEYLRTVAYDEPPASAEHFLYKPVIVTAPDTRIGDVLPLLTARATVPNDTTKIRRVLLYWGHERRIITSDDVLHELLRDI